MDREHLCKRKPVVDSKLKSIQCALEAIRDNHILGYIRKSAVSKRRKVIIPLCSAYFWSHLEYGVQSGALQCK